jgi:hypothetical protein
MDVTFRPRGRVKKTPMVCSTCGFTTTHKANWNTHVNRKNPCQPPSTGLQVNTTTSSQKHHKYPTNDHHVVALKAAHPTARILQKDGYCILTMDEKRYVCSICTIEFKTFKGVQQHLNNKHLSNADNALATQTVGMINNGTINNTINNTIVINGLGSENIDYLTQSPEFERHIQNSIKHGVEGLGQLIYRIHFDEAHKENHNLRKLNKKDDFIEYHNGEVWQLGVVNHVLKRAFELIYKVYDDFITEGRYPINDVIKKQRLDEFVKEVAVPLGWDLTGGEYDFDDSTISDQDKQRAYDNIIRYCKEFIYRMSKDLQQSL